MPTPFQIEAWTEYAVGLFILVARIGMRCKHLGFKWEGDDYFTIPVLLFYTAELVMLELIGQFGSITGMTDEKALKLTPEQSSRIVIGSKCLLAGWVVYTSLIWSRKLQLTNLTGCWLTLSPVKACMLFFYSRLTYV